ncbi:MAG TPA: hypothetical protein VJX94_11590, partial [Stellaceae bacterium]|nr:hypothetical protein [Stellaceae bacterium]
RLHFTLVFPAPHRQNTAPKSQPRNHGREIFTHNVEETTRENVSDAKKIARYVEKVAQTRGENRPRLETNNTAISHT